MSNLETHEQEQAEITADCEAGTCEHPECKAGEVGMICPSCGHVGSFMVVATNWGMVTAEGFDPDHQELPDRSTEWDQYAACMCPACKKSGIVEEFLA